MPPKADVPRVLVNEKSMRRWLKKAEGDPGAQGSENQPAASTNERRKKQKLDVQGDAQSKKKEANEEQPIAKVTPTPPQPQESMNPPTAQKQVGAHTSSGAQVPSSSLPPAMADKWWALFNNSEGPEGGEVNSIFDRRFPVEQVIAREFNKKEDRSRVNKAGMRNVGKHLITMGMQTAFFGYCFDSRLNSVDKELKDRALKIQELTEKLKAVESSTQTIASLEQYLLDAKTKLTTAENEKKATEVKYAELEAKYSTATAEQVKLKKEFDDVVAEKDKLAQDLAGSLCKKNSLQKTKLSQILTLMPYRKKFLFNMLGAFTRQLIK
ncbi:hypothetical protein SESBI_03125 [Sesbania bispinosa]|nr:hypothetical protein SESBI_03125 [Sesbania bispinosa]